MLNSIAVPLSPGAILYRVVCRWEDSARQEDDGNIYWKEPISERTMLSILGEHMFRMTFGSYTVLISDHPPLQDESYREHASLIEHRTSDTPGPQDHFLYLAVSQSHHQWPFLIVSQHYAPGPGAGFYPGVLLVPETSLLFVGAGERLLAYRLDQKALLWEDSADTGFWGWEKYQDVLLMSAELELAAWNIRGEKLWSTFVEPPWDYYLDGDTIHIEVMGVAASVRLYEGPPHTFRWW
jgi:hypothetical protein